jgi:hypothetical protein
LPVNNASLRWLYVKTLLVSGVTALVLATRVDLEWAGAYASASLFGFLNWLALGYGLIAMTEKRFGVLLAALGAKVANLALMLGALIAAGIIPGAFIAGFSTFLLVAVLQGLGALTIGALNAKPGARPLPNDLRSLFMGAPKDA